MFDNEKLFCSFSSVKNDNAESEANLSYRYNGSGATKGQTFRFAAEPL